MTFPADYAPAVVYPAHPTNYRVNAAAPNTPKGFVLHTPEEPADGYPYTPVFFADPNRDASTHYFASYGGVIYQCVPESAMAIANGVIGKPYPSWADPYRSLNWQTLSVEIEGYGASIAQTLTVGGPQWQGLVALIRDRCTHYSIPLDREHIIGHYQVANNRSDPGAGFPWDALIAELQEDEVMKIAPWWTGRKLARGSGEINLNVDFGPADAYEIVIVMAPTNRGQITFKHGDFKMAQVVMSRAANFVLVPGGFGTAPFDVIADVEIAYLACASKLEAAK